MTAVVYERQYWWRSNSNDLSSPHQPPAASRSHHHPCHLTKTSIATHIKNSNSGSSGYNNIQFDETLPISVNFYQSHFSPVIFSPKYRSRKPVIEFLGGKEAEPGVSPQPRMHAQAGTPGSVNVSTVDEISYPRKISSNNSTETNTPVPPPYSSSSCPHTPTTVTCQDSQPVTNTNGTSAISPRKLSTSTNAIADSTNQNSCSWVLKNFSKLSTGSNNSSRGSLSSKNKGGGCPRRRLTDEDGYIRRAACICVNKDETKVVLVSSKKDGCVWLVPGGGMEAGEDEVTAAKREAWEEAGIQGHIARYLGMFESCHHSGVKKHRTAVYIMVVTEEHSDFPEATLGRRRQWFSLEEALLHLARNRPLQSAYIQLLMMSKLKVAAAS